MNYEDPDARHVMLSIVDDWSLDAAIATASRLRHLKIIAKPRQVDKGKHGSLTRWTSCEWIENRSSALVGWVSGRTLGSQM